MKKKVGDRSVSYEKMVGEQNVKTGGRRKKRLTLRKYRKKPTAEEAKPQGPLLERLGPEWSMDELAAYLSAIKGMTVIDWEAVAHQVRTRSASQCLELYMKQKGFLSLPRVDVQSFFHVVNDMYCTLHEIEDKTLAAAAVAASAAAAPAPLPPRPAKRQREAMAPMVESGAAVSDAKPPKGKKRKTVRDAAAVMGSPRRNGAGVKERAIADVAAAAGPIQWVDITSLPCILELWRATMEMAGRGKRKHRL